MKKLVLALACLIGVAFFTSCDPVDVVEKNPSIAVLVEDGYVLDQANVNELDTAYFGFVVASNPESLEKLATLVVKLDDQVWDSLTFTDETEYTYRSGVIYTPAKDSLVRNSIISAVVTDAAGKTNTATLTLNIFYKEQPLTTTPFEWRRDNGHDGTGLEAFGLQWTKNEKTTYAVIRPLEGAILYRFSDPQVWNQVNTVAEKASVFSDITTGIPEFKEVNTTNAHDTYDIVIGTIYQGENHLIHITNSEAYERGWHFVITGEAK